MLKPHDYLKEQIENHIKLFFKPEVYRRFKKHKIFFLNYDKAVNLNEPAIAIPIDIKNSIIPSYTYHVPFNNTELTLFNPIEKPPGKGWQCFPDDIKPVWYKHKSGTLVPAWNLYANLIDLLTFREEREIPKRDSHRRFVGEFSPRKNASLLEVPVFNETVALLVAACYGIEFNDFTFDKMTELIRPVHLILSHDCDLLKGNDFWTQVVRLYRIIEPVLHFKLPDIKNAWWFFRNLITPLEFYYYNVPAMIEVEEMLGFTSIFYLLNGNRGRYGARSGDRLLPVLKDEIREGWDVGIHYNYDTYLNSERFLSQKNKLENLIGRKISAGRAHYLRIDTMKSFTFLSEHGILIDESLGYPDYIGYRAGIAGCFKPYNLDTNEIVDIWEIPLVVMDQTLISQYGNEAVSKFRGLLVHLSNIGGALSLLFHPGYFYNPEFPEALTVYRRLLEVAKGIGAVSVPSNDLCL